MNSTGEAGHATKIQHPIMIKILNLAIKATSSTEKGHLQKRAITIILNGEKLNAFLNRNKAKMSILTL